MGSSPPDRGRQSVHVPQHCPVDDAPRPQGPKAPRHHKAPQGPTTPRRRLAMGLTMGLTTHSRITAPGCGLASHWTPMPQAWQRVEALPY
eukprot:CAMPEP_0181186616 /NCGR_PEP_ID=MMETSP1096-20121128/10128_1 /TAXON_ID=156174 ORGANISM="Chrysochromulina ericina, Strain CCMP281" /NCGR_SAMPLE_ID=MMETSP1096 /ASSEMBLY_ACC=CAM_ASM_000453 /LENGTH=89 /DNA_ID=CAMNT_0023275523 /DNA_START=156 /DNA_END=425 /DNA_ORIENTATION=-